MLTIRDIKKDELNQLLDLYTHLHRKDDPLPPESILKQIWEEIITNHRLSCFILEYNSKMVCSCTLSIIPNLTRGGRPYGLIENVVTHAEYRRRGYGTAILQHALDIAWKNNCYKVMLLTGSKDPAIHQFYQKAGFEKGIKTGFVASKA